MDEQDVVQVDDPAAFQQELDAVLQANPGWTEKQAIEDIRKQTLEPILCSDSNWVGLMEQHRQEHGWKFTRLRYVAPALEEVP